MFAPAGCRVTSPPPPPLNAPTRCHLASHCATLLFIPACCCVTPSCDTTSQRVGWLYVASHCATLTFDPAGCCDTPCCHHHHPSRSCHHLAVHLTADENVRAPEPAARPIYPGHSRKEPHNLPLEGYIWHSKSGFPRDVNPRPRPAQCVERPGERHWAVWQQRGGSPSSSSPPISPPSHSFFPVCLLAAVVVVAASAAMEIGGGRPWRGHLLWWGGAVGMRTWVLIPSCVGIVPM